MPRIQLNPEGFPDFRADLGLRTEPKHDEIHKQNPERSSPPQEALQVNV